MAAVFDGLHQYVCAVAAVRVVRNRVTGARDTGLCFHAGDGADELLALSPDDRSILRTPMRPGRGCPRASCRTAAPSLRRRPPSGTIAVLRARSWILRGPSVLGS